MLMEVCPHCFRFKPSESIYNTKLISTRNIMLLKIENKYIKKNFKLRFLLKLVKSISFEVGYFAF